MTHSDDKGLVLPPKIAPQKTVLVPIYSKEEERTQVMEAAHRIASKIGAKVDSREAQTPGSKFFHWERRGVPIVLELGPRDLASGRIVLKRRDTGEKHVVSQDDIAAEVQRTLDDMQAALFSRALDHREQSTVLANSLEEVEDILHEVTAEKGDGKFVMAHLKDDPACDERLRQFKATVRCIPVDDRYDGTGECIVTGEPVDRRVVIAKAY
jgi:prolyl-tRNA synthetase